MIACSARLLTVVLCLVAMLGCQPYYGRSSPDVPADGFHVRDIAKADVDMVAEITVEQSLKYLRELARKLYVRNPNQLWRGGHVTREKALYALFGQRRPTYYPGLGGRRSAAAIHYAFDLGYTGDRVAAFIEGMRTMLLDAYEGKRSFYLHDSLDPQKLHYLARNFEIAFWQLDQKTDGEGRLLLLSNDLAGPGDLSFERLAGKLIALQDHMASVIADTSNRQIKNVIQSMASAVFFPI